MKGPTPIISEYAYRVLDRTGLQLVDCGHTKGLKDCVAAINERHQPGEKLSYFKAYRGLREDGTYTQTLACPVGGEYEPRSVLILIVWQVGAAVEEPELAPVQSLAVAPLVPTPLEVLIAEAQTVEAVASPLPVARAQYAAIYKAWRVSVKPLFTGALVQAHAAVLRQASSPAAAPLKRRKPKQAAQ